VFRIQLSDPNLLDDLRDSLARADCSTVPVDTNTLLVTPPLPIDAEARMELAFFLRAWQATRPGIELELLGWR
jgi:hypothetical protein